MIKSNNQMAAFPIKEVSSHTLVNLFNLFDLLSFSYILIDGLYMNLL